MAASCAGRPIGVSRTPEGPEPSPTLAPSIFFTEGKLVFFSVNAHLARFRLKDDLIPFEIAVANKGLQNLTVGPEMITLREPKGGSAWPVASLTESLGQSTRTTFDRKLMPVPLLDVVRLRFAGYKPVPATYGFRPGDYAMTRTVEMTKHRWMYAQIWFPNPGGDLKGKIYEVWLDAPELSDPVFVTIKF
jgi:hypothetical protein